MPTALERAGDFSATNTTTGVLIPITDPTTRAPFPGNRIPASRIDRTGAAMMNLFPLPNATDPTGQRQYNAEFINPFEQPRHDRILRVDWPISPKATSYVRLLQDYTGNDGYGQILGALGNGWRQFPHGYDIPSVGAVGALIYTFKPNLIMESMWGITRGHQMNTPLDMDLYNNSLLPLKDAQGNEVPLTRCTHDLQLEHRHPARNPVGHGVRHSLRGQHVQAWVQWSGGRPERDPAVHDVDASRRDKSQVRRSNECQRSLVFDESDPVDGRLQGRGCCPHVHEQRHLEL
jgi:hypothetical protein